jgi:hypothetical protein
MEVKAEKVILSWNIEYGTRSSGNIGCKDSMGHARRGSCKGSWIDEIHALSSPITVVGAYQSAAKDWIF